MLARSSCSAGRFAVGAALALAVTLPSAPAAAQNLLGGPNDPPGPLIWIFTTALIAGASPPMILAGRTAFSEPPQMSRGGGGAIVVVGALMTVPTTAALSMADPRPGWAGLLTLWAGAFWNMTGVGIGTIVDPSGHGGWLGGSMGFGAFSLFHGVLTLQGKDADVPSDVVQAIFGGFGAAGCFVDAGATAGTLRAVGVGCGVASSVGLVDGIVMAAIADHRPRPAPPTKAAALVPVPWVNGRAAGLALTGAF